MQKVLVLDNNMNPLMPCHPARARQLLKQGKAAVYRHYPFIIILKNRKGGDVQPVELRIDPGSKVTGLAVVAQFGRGRTVVWAANLQHKGWRVKKALDKRRILRRSRRSRKIRYRPPRWRNRKTEKGWLSPSLMSRVNNIRHWAEKLTTLIPIKTIAVETIRFDTQLMENPEISGVEYQQGELQGYEVREYLLEKWGRKCVYCSADNKQLEIDHVWPKSRGGSNRVSNLVISCEPCNRAKGSSSVQEFLAHDPKRLELILAQKRKPLRDAAIINAICYRIGDELKELGMSVTFWSGGLTKYNRCNAGYPKDHWIDAACVGTHAAQILEGMLPLNIKAMGRGKRRVCQPDKYGFPKAKPRTVKRVHGFQTGDFVKAVVPLGRKAEGTHVGRVTIRASGYFCISKIDGINWKYCKLLQQSDGYEYTQI